MRANDKFLRGIFPLFQSRSQSVRIKCDFVATRLAKLRYNVSHCLKKNALLKLVLCFAQAPPRLPRRSV